MLNLDKLFVTSRSRRVHYVGQVCWLDVWLRSKQIREHLCFDNPFVNKDVSEHGARFFTHIVRHDGGDRAGPTQHCSAFFRRRVWIDHEKRAASPQNSQHRACNFRSRRQN